MKSILAALLCFILTSCSGSPSQAFEATGFNGRSVMMGTLFDQQTNQRFSPTKVECDALLEEMGKIQPARTAVVEPRFVLRLFTGSSLQSQKIEVFVDETGEGYFRHGTSQPVMFYSATLFNSLKAIDTESNKARMDNPH